MFHWSIQFTDLNEFLILLPGNYFDLPDNYYSDQQLTHTRFD